MPHIRIPPLGGAKRYLTDAAAMVTYEAVADDQEEEIESLMAAVDIEHKQQESSGTYLREQAEPSKKRRLDVDGMSKNLKTASQHVVVSNTLSEYRRLWEQFKQFCCDIDKVKHPDDVEALYPGLPADFPEWIAMWIMDTKKIGYINGVIHQWS
ncbi:hypothetical protein F4604DRAFT_1926179 [Suillus subluteus]|nr:hypothetical protein F4604DRAFT_1926179 [Suillus subluteus]